MKLLGILIFLLGCVAAYGQDITTDTLTWNSVKAVKLLDNSEVIYSCSFKTTGAQSVDWIQKAGAKVYQYSVVGVDGSWSDLSVDGQVTYNLTAENLTGQLVLARQGGQITIHLQTTFNGSPDLDYIFYIESVQPAQ